MTAVLCVGEMDRGGRGSRCFADARACHGNDEILASSHHQAAAVCVRDFFSSSKMHKHMANSAAGPS